MFEWLLGLAGLGWFLWAVGREKRRPQRRQIHCHIDFEDHGEYLDLVVYNAYGCEITASFDWKQLSQVRPEGELPQMVVISGGEALSVCKLQKTGPNPVYSTDWTWVWGSALAQHQTGVVYQLPFEPGKSFSVAQGPGGTFTHTGESYHAVDFDMPVGTPITAARAGLVVDVEGDFRASGLNREAGGNYILIQHEDDTVAEYFHLKTDGVKVEPGLWVEAGDFLGYSGNTGCSNGPHLHLMVFRAVDGRKRESLPMRFRVAGDRAAIELETGGRYVAAELPEEALATR